MPGLTLSTRARGPRTTSPPPPASNTLLRYYSPMNGSAGKAHDSDYYKHGKPNGALPKYWNGRDDGGRAASGVGQNRIILALALFCGGLVIYILMAAGASPPQYVFPPGYQPPAGYDKAAPTVTVTERPGAIERPLAAVAGALTGRSNERESLAEFVVRNEQLYDRHIAKRVKFIAEKGANIKMFQDPNGPEHWDAWNYWYTIWDIFLPVWNCPWETERVGKMGDGGKLTCGLERIQQQRGKKCVVYSFGVNFESSWEVELLERTDCEIWGFDFSVEKWGPQMLEQPYDITKRAHFYKWGVGGVDEVKDGNQFYKLSTLMKMFGHEWIDILKVDIEGSEFEVMPNIVNDSGAGKLPFGQLLLEIHTFKMEPIRNDWNVYSKWWQQMESAGLRAYSCELNYAAFTKLPAPEAMEMNFINNCNGAPNCGTLVRQVSSF